MKNIKTKTDYGGLNMELWIRSKDEMKLVKANNIVVKEAGNSYWIYSNEILVGQYIKTRALEVLDEIQKMLDGRWIKEKIPSATMQNIFPIMLYEMPEE